MRLLVLVVMLVVAALACGDAPASAPVSTPAFERRATEPAPPRLDDAEDGASDDGQPVTIAGRLVDQRGAPIAGRRFRTRGADGDRRDDVTRSDGRIALEGVVPPYDLLVRGGAETGPTLYLGVTRADPVVALFEAAAEPVPAQTVVVGVLAPPCDEERCVVDVVTTSAHGGGAMSALSEPNADGDAVAILEVPHFWDARPGADEPIAVHVLVRDGEARSFSYVRREGAALAAPGERRDAGMLRARAVAASERLRASAGAEGVAPEARWGATASIAIDGARFLLAAAPSPAVTTRVPLLEGARWRAMIEATSAGRSAIAWSGARGPADADVRLVLPALPRDVAVEDGRLRWSAGGGALASIDVLDVGRRRFCCRLVTNETDLALARLEHLGLPPLAEGAHELVVRITPDRSLDAALAAELEEPGGSSYARVSFDVR
ncbi:MAG: hypothetical protein KIT84_26090 [Labilithrix sp.]|nr:hypothetical protein [Labilithrix sp.]MCW5814526.1 hypothetical protein [Labilithrix sp.]